MFGWHLRLSIDAFLGVCPDEAGYSSPSEYIGKLKDRMRRAYKLASETAKKTATDNKRRYDQKVKENHIVEGDTVFVRKAHHTGKAKLADIWKADPYIIVDVPNAEIPVHRLRPVNQRGPVRTLHRNMLVPFNSIPAADEAWSMPNGQRQARKRAFPQISTASQSSSESGSESETSQPYIIPQRRRATGIQTQNPSDSLDWKNGADITSPGIEANRPTHISNLSNRYSDEVAVDRNQSPQVATQPEPVRRSTRIINAPDRYGEWI